LSTPHGGFSVTIIMIKNNFQNTQRLSTNIIIKFISLKVDLKGRHHFTFTNDKRFTLKIGFKGIPQSYSSVIKMISVPTYIVS